MKKYIIIVLTFFLTSFLLNCSSSDNDSKDAERIVQKFYTLLKQNERKEIFKLCGEELFKVASRQELDQMFNTSSTQFGDIKSDSLVYMQTNFINGINTTPEYILIYNVNRGIKNTQEKFTLHQQQDSIKIVGYFITPITIKTP